MPDEHAESTGPAESEPALEALEPRLREAAAWLGLLPPGTALTPAAAATMWGLADEAEAHALLRHLLARGLVEAAPVRGAGGEEMPAYRPLPALEAAAPASHEALLDRYRARTRGGAWHTLPDDGTIHGALAWHLEQAGRHDELRALFAEETATGRNAWHEARERLGQVPGYLQDLERARLRAGRDLAAGGPGAGAALAHQCRYALMASCIHSLAPEIPPALLCALVREGYWSPAQGLAAARRIPDPAQRGDALVGLAAEPAMPAAMTAGLIAAALAIDDEEQRGRALLALARRLPEDQLGLALDAIRLLPAEEQRARALVGLATPLAPSGSAGPDRGPPRDSQEQPAPQLPAPVLEQALAAALALQDSACRVEAVAGLAPHLPAALLPRALAAVVEIEDESRRATALGRLAPHLPEALCRQALAATWRMRDSAARCRAQAGVAPHLPPYWRDKALSAALDCLGRVHHARVTPLLAAMAPHLPPVLQPRALALAESQPDSLSRVNALAALLPHLAVEHREPATDLALRATLLIRGEPGRAEAIARLLSLLPPRPGRQDEAQAAPFLPAGVMESALSMVSAMADGSARGTALSAMAPFLDRRLAGEALSAARTIQDERACARALASLAPLLDSGQQRLALLRVGSLADEKARAIALVALAPVLAPGLLPGALAEARRITDERALAMALAGVAPAFDEAGRAGILAVAADVADPAMRLDALLGVLPCLSATQRVGAIEAAWRAIQALGNEQARVAAMTRLAPHLALPGDEEGDGVTARHGQVLDEALASLAAIRDPERRCQALLALMPHLPASRRDEALAALPLDGQLPAAAVLALIPHLPASLQAAAAGQALAAAGRLPGPARLRVIDGLVPYLDGAQLGEALAAARSIADEEEQVQALVALAPALDTPGRREVLRAVGRLPEAWKRAAILAALVPHLPGALRSEAVALVREPDRAAALVALVAPAPPRQAGSGEGKQAPGAAGLPGVVPHVLRSARRAGDCWAGALALTTLVRLAGDDERPAILREAVEAARGLDDACCRAQTLARLAPHLAGEARQEVAARVLQAVQACAAGPGARLLGQALAAVAPFLPAGQVPAALAEARRLAVPRAWPRRPEENALAALARRLPQETVRQELAAAGTIRGLHLRAQTLSALAVRLAELGHGQEALSAARPIEPLTYQVDALLSLAPHLSLPWPREALDVAAELGRHGAPVAARMALRLAELGEAEEGWRAALGIEGERWQVDAMVSLAPYLPAGRREAAYARALDVARGLSNAGERLGVLAGMAGQLPGDLGSAALREALGAAVELKERSDGAPRRPGQRASATPLAILAEPLATLAAGPDAARALREIWLANGQGERLLGLMGRQPRPTTLLELAVLAPLLARLGGPAAPGEILDAVQQVARWWR